MLLTLPHDQSGDGKLAFYCTVDIFVVIILELLTFYTPLDELYYSS